MARELSLSYLAIGSVISVCSALHGFTTPALDFLVLAQLYSNSSPTLAYSSSRSPLRTAQTTRPCREPTANLCWIR